MPINKKEGESKEDFLSRCIGKEIASGKEPSQAAAICYAYWDEFKTATQSVTDNTWSTEAPISINLEKISIDYDDTLSTKSGKELARRLINTGNELYIISARISKEGMLSVAQELNIPANRVFATGSNKRKVEKVKELGIAKHYDNNIQVVNELPGIGKRFIESAFKKKQKRVIFNEDFDLETVKKYKELGYKVHIRSARKIKRKDNKVWNKLKSVGLTEDAIVFGEVKELNDRYDYDLLMTGQDPILEKLLISGEPADKYKVIKSEVVTSLSEIDEKVEAMIKSVDLKFVRIVTKFRYAEIPGIPEAKSGSRPFCSKLMTANKLYTREEIADLPTSHLKEMGLPDDPFQYRGGFYTNPDSQITTPWCRHQWTAEIVIER